MPTPAQTHYLHDLIAKLAQAGHGSKGDLHTRACADLQISKATLHRYLGEMSVRAPRKKRADAGNVSLPREEAMLISALLLEGIRKNNKRIMTIEHAVDILRSNGKIRADRVDEETGEVRNLSPNAIARALREYKLHPDQLLAPDPVVRMASLHPNHVWQIDASVCVLYYIERAVGLQVMDAAVFYKNKPENLRKIESDMVWRYVITDHTSGWVFTHYVYGGETGVNLCSAFIQAMQQRGQRDPVHGVPKIVMLDPGSANKGHIFKNMCHALQVHVEINGQGNPRAKGQVENGNNLVEKFFESKLALYRVQSIDELNAEAGRWMVWFNGTRVHGRHGMTRFAAWLKITSDQLRFAPSEAVCRELAVSAPESRDVRPELQVSVKGQIYDVRNVPGVIVGEKLMVCRNPWQDDTLNVITYDAQNNTVFHVCEAVLRNDWGFAHNAPVIGETYHPHMLTPAQRNKTRVELLAMGSTTQESAAEKRKAKALAFDGKLDPFKPMQDTQQLPYLPRRGTPNPVQTPAAQSPVWGHTKTALHLAMVWKLLITPAMRDYIEKTYPDGVPENDIADLAELLSSGNFAQPSSAGTSKLKVVR